MNGQQPTVERSNTWTEYGVQLASGVILPAASAAVVHSYPHGWPVCRKVLCTPRCLPGDADVDAGSWVSLRFGV